MRINSKQYAIWAGLLLCSAAVAPADTLVTFQVDMSNAGIDPSSQTVSAHGTFNGWGAFELTNNPSGSTPYLYTGTTNVAGNGTVMQYKYVIDPGTYEGIVEGSGHNRLITLPATSGASLILPKVYFNDTPPSPVTVAVTFQLDLAQQINVGNFAPGTSLPYARGFYNGWAADVAMTNDPTILRTNQYGLVTSNIYVATYSISGSPGQTTDYKYYIDTGANWESPAANTGDPNDNNNRFFNLSGGTVQAVPIVFFNDAPYAPVATNDVTFQVDMTAQVLNGAFDPQTGTVEVRGNFNSWGTPQILCTNDPAALNTNIYKAVVRLMDGVGASEFYKFWASVSANSGWETMADNRSLTIISGTSQVLPVVFFSNVDPYDLLPADTLVTFTVNMTNAVGTDLEVFDPSVSTVWLDGDFLNWTWSSAILLTNNPIGSELYQIGVLIPKGNSVALTYKYSINGIDNEAPSGQNHVRDVRTTGTYALPLDTFGHQYGEPSFGQLAAGRASGGRVPVSWLGRPGVHLQTKADLSSGSWQDLLNTDGANWANGYSSTNGFISVTNYPTSAAKTFFRLIKP
jgi:hypothetical protein